MKNPKIAAKGYLMREMNRREFFKVSLMAGASSLVAARLAAEGVDASAAVEAGVPDVTGGRLLGSAPVLLNPSERTIDVAFAVNGDASGWVEISKSPDMEKSVRVYSGEGPVMRVNGKFAVVRIKGLRPATRYWYRIGADRIELERDYKPWNRGSEADDKAYSFTTPGAESGGSFCVMQDTHSVADVVDQVFAKIAALKPSAIVWNGDARNFYRTADDAVGTFL